MIKINQQNYEINKLIKYLVNNNKIVKLRSKNIHVSIREHNIFMFNYNRSYKNVTPN